MGFAQRMARCPLPIPSLRVPIGLLAFVLPQEGEVEAKELWESKQEEIARYLPSHLVQRISLALATFEFDTALSLLPGDSAEERPSPGSQAIK